jgi:uncharacterized membrane protein YgdD (TMEM256/DUF423 family)
VRINWVGYNLDFVRIGAALAFLGIALGAFGTHALKTHLSSEMLEVWHTAVLYQFLHAIAIFVLGLYSKSSGVHTKTPNLLFLSGILLFSGSLYALAVTGIKPLGAVTPVGGLCFLAGWGLLAVKGVVKAR